MPGPQTPASIATFHQRYCQPGEGHREVCNRIAYALADDSNHYHELREILSDLHYSFAGRIMNGAGSTKQVCLHNCFVSGTIPDSLTGIMQRCTEGALTMQRGGGIGYDFSTLRPRGDAVRSVQGKSSGPISYIRMYDAMGRTISSAGERRGAQMGILRVDHPDIEEFIYAKHNGDQITSFNLSIAITDAFMHAVVQDTSFDLTFEERVYRTIRARDLWETIMRSTWDWAEPGVIFIDRINEENNLGYCEVISATNPCSEQPLPPFGACLLGSFNLTSYLRPTKRPVLANGRYTFDWRLFYDHIPVIVKAMDNVIDCALYPLQEQRIEALATRRMGIGIMGLANCLEALGMPYGSPEFVKEEDNILNNLKCEAYSASAWLAHKKGPFPLYLEKEYLERPFIKSLPKPIQAEIKDYGIRNSHLISIAPTGTISFCMDNISSGIEPVFAPLTRRKVRGFNEPVTVTDYGVAKLGTTPKTANEVSAEEHISVLCTAQKHCDSAVSKTCNVSSDMPWDRFKDLYFLAWRNGAKGCATFQNGGKREGVMQAVPTLRDCENGRCEMG